jgi:hypothetical protein
MSTREKVIEVCHLLFIHTDNYNWSALQSEVFTEEVQFDMSSMGGEVKMMRASEICDAWAEGFADLDSVNHLSGNYIVTFLEDGSAQVFCYATATHFKEAATNGQTREYVGTYDLHLMHSEDMWRIDAFRYNLKYASGNLDLS